MRKRVLIAALFIAHGAVLLGQFVLPVAGAVWIEQSLGGSKYATWLALLAFLPLFALTGLCLVSPLWALLGRAADRIGAGQWGRF